MLWKPTTTEKKNIRAYAAKFEKLRPAQIIIEAGERVSLVTGNTSFNVLLIDQTPDWDESDLHDTHGWTDTLTRGIPLTEDGRAVTDYYVYEKVWNDHGDLLTNVQTHVAMLNGKPTLWKLTGTMMPVVIVNEELAAQFATEPKGIDG